MIQKLKAIYREGAFVPTETFTLPEETMVEITVDSPQLVPAIVVDETQRRRRLSELTQRMQRSTIPPGAPKFTREELHERR